MSKGSVDKSLIEIKLASNSQLKRNLQNQVEVYEKANGTRTSVKMIVCYTEADVAKVDAVLKELDLRGEKSIVVITHARTTNLPDPRPDMPPRRRLSSLMCYRCVTVTVSTDMTKAPKPLISQGSRGPRAGGDGGI